MNVRNACLLVDPVERAVLGDIHRRMNPRAIESDKRHVEVADEIGVEKNSIGLLGYKEGKVEVEILQPPTVDLEKSVDRILDKYQDAFAEMKRLGD